MAVSLFFSTLVFLPWSTFLLTVRLEEQYKGGKEEGGTPYSFEEMGVRTILPMLSNNHGVPASSVVSLLLILPSIPPSHVSRCSRLYALLWVHC